MSYSKKKLPGWRGAVVRAGRELVAMAMLSAAGAASAGYVTFDQGAMNAIFSQHSFDLYDIDIRFNTPLWVVEPSLLDINSTAEFSGSSSSLGSLSSSLGLSNSTVAMFFVDKISFCDQAGSNIIGCGSSFGSLIALDSAYAASANGAILMAHELGHNLGLVSHVVGSGNLMNPSITGATTLTKAQIGTFIDLSAGVSRNSIVQLDGDQFYISITPIAVLAAAPVPEPQTWAMMLAGLLGVAGWARRRRACAG